MMSRARSVVRALGGIVALFAAVGVGWLGAASFVSPEQRAAAASPPPPTDIVVAVRNGALAETLTARAQVGDAGVSSVSLSLGADLPVVTAAPLGPGQVIDAGAVILEVSGRPVFALPGKFPFYRDLKLGDVGPDVEQLQLGLQAAGYGLSADGVFGARTAAAVVSMYVAAGYNRSMVVTLEPVEPSPAIEGGTASSAPDVSPPTDESVDTVSQEASPPPEASDSTPAPLSSPPPAGPVSTAAGVAPPAVTVREVVTVAYSDFAVLPTLPRQVANVPAVGTLLSAENSLVGLTDGTLSITSSIPAATALQIPEGSPVALTGPDGLTISAVTGAISGDPAAGEVTLSYVADASQIPPTARGAELLATITAEVVAQEALIVPTRAVIAQATGYAVLKQMPDGSLAEISVRQLGTLAGQSAIEPEGEANSLVAGDLVIVR